MLSNAIAAAAEYIALAEMAAAEYLGYTPRPRTSLGSISVDRAVDEASRRPEPLPPDYYRGTGRARGGGGAG